MAYIDIYARAQKKMFLALNHKSIAYMFIDIFVWRLDLLTFSTLNFYKLCSQMCEVKKRMLLGVFFAWKHSLTVGLLKPIPFRFPNLALNWNATIALQSVLERIWIKGSYLSWPYLTTTGWKGTSKESKSRWIEILEGWSQ